MISAPPAATPSASSRRAADWWLAVFATVAVLALHFYFLNRVGGLYRDEVCSVNLAQGEFKNITHDSFPVLFPLLLRGWNSLGFCNSDLAARSFGVLMGLCLTATFWVAARWTRRAPPLWSLALVALNAWVIYYSASLRAYGLGTAMIALCTAAGWRFVQNPGRNSWLLFTATAVLSVQTLYQNSVLVAAVCAGASAVAWRGKNFKLVIAIFLAGLVAAISLLPYYANVAGMSQSAAPLRMDFDWRGGVLDFFMAGEFSCAAVVFHAAGGGGGGLSGGGAAASGRKISRGAVRRAGGDDGHFRAVRRASVGLPVHECAAVRAKNFCCRRKK